MFLSQPSSGQFKKRNAEVKFYMCSWTIGKNSLRKQGHLKPRGFSMKFQEDHETFVLRKCLASLKPVYF